MQKKNNNHSNESKEEQNVQIQQIQTKLDSIRLENAKKLEDNENKNEQNQQVKQNQDDQQEDQQQEQQQQDQQQDKGNSKWKKVQQPEKKVGLYMIDFDHCDRKKCSGQKLSRFKLLTELDKKKKFKGIVLSAFGKKQVSYEDLQYAQKCGVCVVDCSWNRIEQTRQFRYKHQRKLPFVTAGNPVNYGKPYQLSCAQALATALCAIGYIDQAEYIMSKFGWSDGFWSLNPLIENYGKCKTLDQLKIQSKKIEQMKTNSFQRNYDLSDPQSSEQQN